MCDNEDDNKQKQLASPVSDQTSLSEDSVSLIAPTTLSIEDFQFDTKKEITEDDLIKAVTRCKELILENEQCSVERKWLVRHLIELRLQIQEYREAMNDPQHPRHKSNNVSSRSIKGHHLQLQPLLRSANHNYCDHCTGTIWSFIQAWYECTDCGYVCHYKCIASIVRECAHVIACEKGQYELNICPEIGMSSQKYTCAECKAPLVINKDWTEARQCDYTGLYYCSACHWNGSAVIPARVVHNWDTMPRAVCQASLQILRITANRPMIHLEKLNPKLFVFIQELNLVRRLRQELRGLRKYLLVCRKANENHLLWKCDTPHLIENVDMYSLQDLVDAASGDLLSKLQNLVDLFSTHVTKECDICKGRGHICEICKNKEILFPFSPSAHICLQCNAVLHKQCIARKKTGCPKCNRIKIRMGKETEQNNVNVIKT